MAIQAIRREEGIVRILKEPKETLRVYPGGSIKRFTSFSFIANFFFLLPRFIFQTIPLALHFRDIRSQIGRHGVTQGPITNLFKSFYGENVG